MSRLSPDDVVLGLLAAKTSHGYDMLEHFRAPEKLGHVWHLSTSQLYAILKRLENNDLVTGREVASPDAPTRTEYHLTDTGAARFDAWMHTPTPSASTRHIRTEFLSRLYLARLLNLPAAPIIQHQRDACQQRKQTLQETRCQSQNGIGVLSLELMIDEMDVILRWIDRCESGLAALYIPSGVA